MKIAMHTFWLSALLFLTGTHALANDCPPPPKAQDHFNSLVFYTDSANSVIDKEKQAKYKESLAPTIQFISQIEKFADNSNPQCAAYWLDAWATENAWMGNSTGQDTHDINQGNNERRNFIVAAAMVYFKVRNHATPEQAAHIHHWMEDLGDILVQTQLIPYNQNKRGSKNNHYYWIGWGLLSVGMITENKRYIAYGKDIYEKAIDDLTDDGTLPYELSRKTKALHYHMWATTAITAMAEIAKNNGEDWYGYRHERIKILYQFIADSIMDETKVNTLSKAPKQDESSFACVPAYVYSWVPLAQQRFPDLKLANITAGQAECRFFYIGGKLPEKLGVYQ